NLFTGAQGRPLRGGHASLGAASRRSDPFGRARRGRSLGDFDALCASSREAAHHRHAIRRETVMTRLLDQLLARDQEINESASGRLNSGAAHEHRGNLRINLGFAEAGWNDLRRAEMLAGTRISYSLAAKLGEARRVYARDVIWNSPENVGLV